MHNPNVNVEVNDYQGVKMVISEAGFIILNGQKKLPPTQNFFGPRSMYFS